jgi:hypothetical protein
MASKDFHHKESGSGASNPPNWSTRGLVIMLANFILPTTQGMRGQFSCLQWTSSQVHFEG